MKVKQFSTQKGTTMPRYEFHDGLLTTITPSGRVCARPITAGIKRKLLNVMKQNSGTKDGYLCADDSFVGNVNHYLLTGKEYEPQDEWTSRHARTVIFSDELMAELKKFK